MSHSNISIFIPHLGCPCRCSFCNQNSITGENHLPDENEIDQCVETALESERFDKKTAQLAFFGGSFTAIDKNLVEKYLKIGYKHIKNGSVDSIRVSTRPDAIDNDILTLLKQYGVKSIELGAQSMCDDVLEANNRGHFAKDVEIASNLIKKCGFELGLQMMTGLFKSDDEKDLFTVQKFIELNPDTVRIYPTIVIKNTLLEKLYKDGVYTPQSVEQATVLGSKLLKMFYNKNINVIRFGLHSIDKKSFVCGPWHPALSEIAQSKIYYDLMKSSLNEKGFYTVFVDKSEVSKAIGQKQCNIINLRNQGFFVKVKSNESVNKYDIIIKKGQ